MKTILVVEDDFNIAKLQKIILEDFYNVEIVNDGSLAFKIIKECMPDLVLLDLMLPGVNGLQICSAVKKDAALKNVKVVMVTAKTDLTDEERGLGLGADDYICKPFEPEELLHVVKQQIG
jgi:DNA-binding response OmpR family regulator